MSTPFSRSLRAIEGDGRGLGRWLAPLGVVLVSAWGTWMVRAEVPVYAASTSARLVRERAVHPLQSGVDGRVVALHVTLDQPVAAGALVLELDAHEQRLALAEERARLAALEGELEATRAAVAALAAARDEARNAVTAVRAEAELERTARELSQRYADEEADRLTQLEETGTVSKLTASRARTDAEIADVSVRQQGALLERLVVDLARDDQDRAALLAERRRELAAKDGAREVSRATIARLEHEVERRTLRAPAAGVVAELAALSPGAFVRAGQPLGAVVAEGRLAVEAEFRPADALGRVRLGQAGELVLAGFPRAEFGTLDVSVERIASEPREGAIRVELGLDPSANARIPLEHGLPGSVRIEIQRTTPAALVLRAIGGSEGAAAPAQHDG
jgi:membrane fusion protein (multidrug efflux system)